MTLPLSPTERTTIRRGASRALSERAGLHALLDDALVAHVGVVVDDHPVVIPVAFAVDLDGPDEGGTLYLHGSVAARWLTQSGSATVCVTVTELDGNPLANGIAPVPLVDDGGIHRVRVVLGPAPD